MFKLGADPEIFLQDAAQGFISAIGRIGGSKENPLPLSDLGPGFAVQEDNVAVEYNIPASGSKAELITNINRVMAHLSETIAKQGLHFSNESAVAFPIDQLCHPAAMVFGCDPDFNAWRNGARNPRPKADDPTLRSCGGHIHVGYDFSSKSAVINFIKYMDLFLGVPSTVMDNGDLRKQLYGKGGAFRFKPYGCEYRVLSNYWTLDSALISWTWDATTQAMDAWQKQQIDVDAERSTILQAINRNDKQVAADLIAKYNLPMVNYA